MQMTRPSPKPVRITVRDGDDGPTKTISVYETSLSEVIKVITSAIEKQGRKRGSRASAST